jgi:hypothetical protein
LGPVLSVLLGGLGVLILLAAAFDMVPSVSDNTMIFWAIACFVVMAMVKKLSKGCCK